jgi:hypothetical protein
LAEAIRDRRVSAYAVAVELGWVQRPPNLGNGSDNAARRRRIQLSRTVADDGIDSSRVQELWLGPSHDGTFFSSPDELRATWEQNKSEVMRLFAHNGHRPQGWWEFEAPALGLTWPGYFREQSCLYDAGLLGDDEKAELERWWRIEFERTYGPDFFYTEAPGEILHGAAARRKHLDWADVPHSLRRQWTAERRRRGRAIRKLEAEAGEPPPVVA